MGTIDFNDGTSEGRTLPSVQYSESIIAEYAVDALDKLQKYGAMDLVDILGLNSYVK